MTDSSENLAYAAPDFFRAILLKSHPTWLKRYRPPKEKFDPSESARSELIWVGEVAWIVAMRRIHGFGAKKARQQLTNDELNASLWMHRMTRMLREESSPDPASTIFSFVSSHSVELYPAVELYDGRVSKGVRYEFISEPARLVEHARLALPLRQFAEFCVKTFDNYFDANARSSIETQYKTGQVIY